TNITQLAAGGRHSLAIQRSVVTIAGRPVPVTTVLAWGENASGQLGNPTAGATSATPVTVSGLVGVTQVAAGDHHSLALKADGTVVAWGGNELGQLGDGSTTNRPSPVAVPGLTNVAQVAAGFDHSLALKGDGTVLAWGNNTDGQLG